MRRILILIFNSDSSTSWSQMTMLTCWNIGDKSMSMMILWQRSCHSKWNMKKGGRSLRMIRNKKKRKKEVENDKEDEEEEEDSEWETLWYFGDSICVTAPLRSHCLRLLHHSYKPLTKNRSSHCDASCRIVKFFQLIKLFVVVVAIGVSEAIFEWFVTQGSCFLQIARNHHHSKQWFYSQVE